MHLSCNTILQKRLPMRSLQIQDQSLLDITLVHITEVITGSKVRFMFIALVSQDEIRPYASMRPFSVRIVLNYFTEMSMDYLYVHTFKHVELWC